MTLRYLKIGATGGGGAGRRRGRAPAARGAGRALHPDLRLPHRRLRAERHPDRRRLQGLLHPAQRARRRHRGREDHPRGVRDQLRHQGRRGVLRAAEEQGPARDQPVLHRHHLRADPEGAGRQDPDPVDGLWPHRCGGRPRAPWVFTTPTSYWSQASAKIKYIAAKEGGLDKLKGKKIALDLSQQPLRQGADPDAARRCPRNTASKLELLAVDSSGPGAEGDVAQGPPDQARLDHVLGLGRDEPGRRQGSGRHRLQDGPHGRRVVVGHRGRRRSRRRCRQGLHLARRSMHPGKTSRSTRTSRSSSTTRARARRAGTRSARCSTTAASSTP